MIEENNRKLKDSEALAMRQKAFLMDSRFAKDSLEKKYR